MLAQILAQMLANGLDDTRQENSRSISLGRVPHSLHSLGLDVAPSYSICFVPCGGGALFLESGSVLIQKSKLAW